jgi:hypothetical protein
MTIAVGVFVAMHGLVHAMYVGQALRWFELREGMTWPVGARFVPAIPDAALRVSAANAVGVSSLALVVGGIGIAMDAGWGPTVTLVAAIVASVVHLLLWDGDVKTFPDQGLYGIVINVVIVVWIVATR